jgi:hypothetical protein
MFAIVLVFVVVVLFVVNASGGVQQGSEEEAEGKADTSPNAENAQVPSRDATTGSRGWQSPVS